MPPICVKVHGKFTVFSRNDIILARIGTKHTKNIALRLASSVQNLIIRCSKYLVKY